jgi:hypothetical protein
MRFINNDDLVSQVNSQGFSGGLLQQQVIRQSDKLKIKNEIQQGTSTGLSADLCLRNRSSRSVIRASLRVFSSSGKVFYVFRGCLEKNPSAPFTQWITFTNQNLISQIKHAGVITHWR